MSPVRILVVDDDPQIRRVLRSLLAARGYQALEARTGEDARDCLRHERVDLVLLDVNMPGMGGLETCRKIRASSEIAIIMLTVSDAEDDKVAALDAGADDYITKPFSTPELLARVRAALRRLPAQTEQAGDTLQLGDLQIHLARRSVLRNGQPVRLTPKEFDLLQYLLHHSNTPVPHAKLLQAIWGMDYRDQVQYLRVFVNQLRKKIEPDPSQPRYILTEPWIGYKFALPPVP